MKYIYCQFFLSAFLCQSVIIADDGVEFFEKQVRPLLVKRCYKCHAGEKSGGGLSMETASGWKKGGESGAAIIPGQPQESLLIEAINYQSLEMPPADEGGKLPQEEIEVLTKWIIMGAPDPRTETKKLGGMSFAEAKNWWSFQPLPKLDSPLTPEKIDGLLQSEIDKLQFEVAPPADRRTLIRRVTYGLTGLPPTMEEVNAFLGDGSSNAFAKVVDRLLASPQYGVHWGRHWLDVVRYADTAGENTDRPLPHAWRYRNWVVDSLNNDLPYDQFVRMQIAGDLLEKESTTELRTNGIIATGYLAIARRFGHDIDKDIHLTYEDVIDNLGKNFLGLTFGCARCHDHKYDPVTSKDYYALLGVFDSTKFSFPGCEPKGQPRDLIPLADPNVVTAAMSAYQQELEQFNSQTQRLATEGTRLKELAANSYDVLAAALVPEGQSVSLHENQHGRLDEIALRKGEVLQLTILRNENYGADTTRLELEITQVDSPNRNKWNINELIPRYTTSGPVFHIRGATWCLLDVTDGPAFLKDKKSNLNGQASLDGWANGDNPSSLVNSSSDPVAVWTTLPGNSLFVHPGPAEDVAVAWVCPQDGTYQVRGLVEDAHPAGGLDGVSFQFERIANAEFGEGLAALGRQTILQQHGPPEKPSFPVAYAVAEGDIHHARLQLRGDPEQLGEEIPRSWLEVFGNVDLGSDQSSGRSELAEQIVGLPLFARVMVNRVWAWHFGRGLVDTPNDFGARGSSPTHPELLDLLASQFQASGYRLKPLHRLIVQTSAYQRSGVTESFDLDPENHWLTRFSARRLTAEELRDSLLAASGQLDLSPGGPHPFPAEETWTFTQHNPFTANYDTSRRSFYLMVQRQRRHPFLALFDGADPNSSTPQRDSTTVPAQALYFLNDPFFHSQAVLVSERLSHADDFIPELFGALFQRIPTKQEMEVAQIFLNQHSGDAAAARSALVRVLMSSNEFLFLD